MFGALEDILNFNASSPLKGKGILITERGADGSFMLHHLIATYLRGGHYVCLVGLAETFTHYSCVAAKLSLNLAASRDAGQFVFIDALRTIGDEIFKNSSSDCISSDVTTARVPPESSSTSSRLPLRDLYETIKSGLDQLREWRSKPTLLVVDELSLLLILGHSTSAVSILANQLQLLVCPTEQSQGTFSTLIHTGRSANDKEIDQLQKEISYKCHQLIYIDCLKTGYCREVSGEVFKLINAFLLVQISYYMVTCLS